MNFFSSIVSRFARRRTYADLMSLDDHILRDIGVTRTDLALMMADGRLARPASRTHG